ncbi:MAG: two-component regulator propeller domain-containing protein, partial [Vicinamibacteraceae bacterium]
MVVSVRSSGARRLRFSVGALQLVCMLGLPAVTQPVQAERLPIRVYTSTDGLTHDSVRRIVHDSRGFLWFCTQRGLSRFDGIAFRNYDHEDGLPIHAVNDLLEDRSGRYWVATNGSGVG